MTFTLRSPAKINLWLRILGKREDGFHDLETRLCPLHLADEVRLSPSATGAAELVCSNPEIPVDETNLALKALRAFEQAAGVAQPWRIHLEKNIPHGAGLGGGSSNAAAVLLALNQLNGYPLGMDLLRDLAARLGSDVPFFLHRQTCDASGRGETLTPVKEAIPPLPLLLIKPSFNIATPWAYQRWSVSQELAGACYAPQHLPWGIMQNDLERPVFEKWILLPTLKNWLLEQKETVAALMSGSGSTVFAITGTPGEAQALAEKAAALCGPSTWIKVTQTL